jgi:hypothetical protein
MITKPVNTGLPKNVEPAGLRHQAGQNRRRHRPLTASNNPPQRCSRQVRGLVALPYALPTSVWIRLRKNCAPKEVL